MEIFLTLETLRTDIIRMWSEIILIWGSVIPSRRSRPGGKHKRFSPPLH